MASASVRSRLGRVFHRREASDASHDASTAAEGDDEFRRPASRSHGVDNPRRSLGDFVRSRSQSMSRSKSLHRRGQSADVPSTPMVPDGVNVPSRPRTRDARQPQRPSREGLPVDPGLVVLKATGPSVPARSTSLQVGQPGPVASTGNAVPIYSSMMRADDPFCEKVADWNLVRNEQSSQEQAADLPAPLRVSKSHGLLSSSPESRSFRHETSGRLAHKPDIRDLRNSMEPTIAEQPVRQVQSSTTDPKTGLRRITRKSLDKALPSMPIVNAQNTSMQGLGRPDSGIDSELGRKHDLQVKNTVQSIDLTGVVDLTNTEEVHEYVEWAPAVTQEKRIVNTHEIIQEEITREIHNHHVYHRVLPVIDIEVLPPRHFIVGDDGVRKEISEAEVPGGYDTAKLHNLISQAVAKMMPEKQKNSGPRQFTARSFEGTEGDYREYMTPEGFKRTEQWWVHPPTLETGGQESGQTQPFHFGSANPKDDGLRESHVSSGTLNFSRRKPIPSNESGTHAEASVRESQPSSTHTVLPIRMPRSEMYT